MDSPRGAAGPTAGAAADDEALAELLLAGCARYGGRFRALLQVLGADSPARARLTEGFERGRDALAAAASERRERAAAAAAAECESPRTAASGRQSAASTVHQPAPPLAELEGLYASFPVYQTGAQFARLLADTAKGTAGSAAAARPAESEPGGGPGG